MDNSNTFDDSDVCVGKVYKLVCKDPNVKECYIGSSTNLISRLQKHKFNALNERSTKHHLKVYKKIREYGNWHNWKCEVIAEIKNPTKQELIQLERKHYEEHLETATLNNNYCGRTREETNKAWSTKNPYYAKNYRIENAVELKKYNQKYYAENKKKVLDYNREKLTCKCGAIVNRSGTSRHNKTKKHIGKMRQLEVLKNGL